MTKGATTLACIAFGIVFCAMGSMAIKDVVAESNLTSKIDSQGARALARVMEHYDYGGKDPHLTLEYEVGGSPYSKSIHVTQKDYFGLQDGSTAQIAYLKGDPKQVRLVGSTYVHTPKSIFAVGAVAFLIGLSLIGYGLYFAKYGVDDTLQ